MTIACRHCKFWIASQASSEPFRLLKTFNEGETETVEMRQCRRFPTFESKREDDWCGEFKAHIPTEMRVPEWLAPIGTSE